MLATVTLQCFHLSHSFCFCLAEKCVSSSKTIWKWHCECNLTISIVVYDFPRRICTNYLSVTFKKWPILCLQTPFYIFHSSFSRNAVKWKYYRVRGKIRYINGKYEFEVRLGFVVGVQKLLILIVSMTGWNLIISRMHSFYKSWSTVNPFQKNMIVRRRLWLQLENVVTSFHYYIVLILKSIYIFHRLNFLCNYIFSK